jgi:thiol:disulfide interchange protein DsbD
MLEADYQGCRDGDICYPPQTGRVSVLMSASDVAIDLPVTVAEPAAASLRDTPPAPLSEQDRLARLLLDKPSAALFAFFIAGLLLAFTPCVFPMVPILSGIIAGEGQRLTTARAFWLSLVYVLAMAATYTIAGVLAGLFGKNLQAAFQNPWIIGGFVAVFVALALSMFGFYELQLPSRWQSAMARRSNREGGGRFGGVAVMGFLSALIVGPCVAPPLAAALIVIGASGDPVLGGTALFALSMGMGVPLIVFGVSAGRLIPRAGAWMNAVKAVFGVGLLALGVWMLERIVPGPVILFLWGLLAIGSGVFLGALQSLPAGASGWRKLWKAFGLALLVIGAAELAGAAAGNSNWLKPMAGLGTSAAQAEHVAFRRIKSLADLEVAIAQANAAGKPAMLDFYADWCVECIRMERNTFPEPGVQALLSQLRPLQADVTPNDAVDQALMQQFGIIGPPAILFFDRQGNEMPAYRLVGYFKPDAFAAHLQRVIDAP